MYQKSSMLQSSSWEKNLEDIEKQQRLMDGSLYLAPGKSMVLGPRLDMRKKNTLEQHVIADFQNVAFYFLKKFCVVTLHYVEGWFKLYDNRG